METLDKTLGLHYEVDHAALANQMGGTKNFGPLSLKYSIDLSVPRILAEADLYGVKLGSVVLDPQHPTATIGGSVGIAKAEVKLTVDFKNSRIEYDIDVEAFGKTLVNTDGVLFSW